MHHDPALSYQALLQRRYARFRIVACPRHVLQLRLQCLDSLNLKGWSRQQQVSSMTSDGFQHPRRTSCCQLSSTRVASLSSFDLSCATEAILVACSCCAAWACCSDRSTVSQRSCHAAAVADSALASPLAASKSCSAASRRRLLSSSSSRSLMSRCTAPAASCGHQCNSSRVKPRP